MDVSPLDKIPWGHPAIITLCILLVICVVVALWRWSDHD